MIDNTTQKTISIRLDIASYNDVIAYCKRNHILVSEAIRPVLRREFKNPKPGNPVKAELQPNKPKQKSSKPVKPKQKIDYAKDYLKYGKWNSKAKTWTCLLCGAEAGGGQKFIDHLKKTH